VDRVRDIEQFIEEVPPIQIHLTRLITQRGHCPHCGWVRTTHPMQMSLSSGCAKVQLGPMALALAADLKHRIGLTYRKLCSVLRLLGLSVSAGGLAQALARVARKLSCGNKTDAGRCTWQILSSLATTCSQRTHPFTGLVAAAMPLSAPLPSLPAVKG